MNRLIRTVFVLIVDVVDSGGRGYNSLESGVLIFFVLVSVLTPQYMDSGGGGDFFIQTPRN